MLVAAAPAVAQPSATSDDTARSLFQAGRSAFEAGQYEAALHYFEESFSQSGRPQLQYNIGVAADRLRQDGKALAAFRAYLKQVPHAENRDEVEARIRALERARATRESKLVNTGAPTPEQTARASSSGAGSEAMLAKSAAANEPSDGRPAVRQWWFWTTIGAVVIGGVITAVALSSGGDQTAAPFESRSGVTVMALRSP